MVEVQFAVKLTTNDMQGHPSVYENMTRVFFPSAGDSVGCTAGLLQ